MRRETSNSENERTSLTGIEDSDDEEETYIYSRGSGGGATFGMVTPIQSHRASLSPTAPTTTSPWVQYGATNNTTQPPPSTIYPSAATSQYQQQQQQQQQQNQASIFVGDSSTASAPRSGRARKHRGQGHGGMNIKSLSRESGFQPLPSSSSPPSLPSSSVGGGRIPTVNGTDGSSGISVNSTPPADLHHFYPAIRTLSAPDLGPQLHDVKATNDKDIKLVKANLRWKTACGISSFVNIFLFVLILTSLIYWLFFRDPFIFIEQVQISHIPIADTDLGFNVKFQVDNPSLFNTTITSCYLAVVIVDPSSNVEYDITSSIEMNASQSIARGSTIFTVASTISIAKNPYFLQISKLVTLGRFGVRLSGHMGYTVASFERTASLSKYQQLYTSNIRS